MVLISTEHWLLKYIQSSVIQTYVEKPLIDPWASPHLTLKTAGTLYLALEHFAVSTFELLTFVFTFGHMLLMQGLPQHYGSTVKEPISRLVNLNDANIYSPYIWT